MPNDPTDTQVLRSGAAYFLPTAVTAPAIGTTSSRFKATIHIRSGTSETTAQAAQMDQHLTNMLLDAWVQALMLASSCCVQTAAAILNIHQVQVSDHGPLSSKPACIWRKRRF